MLLHTFLYYKGCKPQDRKGLYEKKCVWGRSVDYLELRGTEQGVHSRPAQVEVSDSEWCGAEVRWVGATVTSSSVTCSGNSSATYVNKPTV